MTLLSYISPLEFDRAKRRVVSSDTGRLIGPGAFQPLNDATASCLVL